MVNSARDAIETVARNSYGRLLAFLASRSGDVDGAEDALGDAVVAALRHWPVNGIPAKPEAWLLQVARNKAIDKALNRQVHQKYEPALQQLYEEAQYLAQDEDRFPDERLKLLFVCAHPAIDAVARTPLMLQAVLGLDAGRIASAFLTSPSAMSQRLVRAKMKIRNAKIPFRVPEPAEWEDRVAFVLDAIYSAYTTGWCSLGEPDAPHLALAGEAIELGRVLVALMPDEAEAYGLLALMLHCEARSGARYGEEGQFVPLDCQDPARWSVPMIREAEEHLRQAVRFNRMGRYQLEAAIQSIHAARLETGWTNWSEIVLLYEGLVRIAPGIGSLVGRAVALAQAGSPESGMVALDAIPLEKTIAYQPYWAARGHLASLLGRTLEAHECYERSAGLTANPAQRDYLFRQSKGGRTAGKRQIPGNHSDISSRGRRRG